MSGTNLHVQSLEEKVTYTFTVRAQTIDYGPPLSSNVTTGPQEGSPGTPKELALVETVSSVEVRWINGPTGKGQILGYYIESKRKGKFVKYVLFLKIKTKKNGFAFFMDSQG